MNSPAVLATLLLPALMSLIGGWMLWALSAAVRRDATPGGRSSLVRLAHVITGLLIAGGVMLIVPGTLIVMTVDRNKLLLQQEETIAAFVLILLTLGSLMSISMFTIRFSLMLSDVEDEAERDVVWSRLNLWLRFVFFGPLSLGLGRIHSVEHGSAVAHALGWWLILWGTLLCIVTGVALPIFMFIGIVLLVGMLLVSGAAQVMSIWSRWVHERHWTLWQVYLAIRSRRPLAEEFDLLSQYAWGKRRRQLRDMCEEVEEGAEPDDMFVHPTLLSSLEGAQVATGMKTGKLPQVLADLVQRQSDYAERMSRTQNPIVSSVYLWVQLLFFWAIFSYVMYYIMPKFKKIFDDFNIELPAATVSMLRMSDSFFDLWYLAIPAFVFVAVSMTVLMFVPFITGDSRFREWASRFWPRICLPDILRALALAVEAQIPLEEALLPFVRRQLRISLHSRLVRVQEAIRDGHNCWDEMTRQQLLSVREATLLKAAEAAGNLPWALQSLSVRHEQRWYFGWLFAAEFLQPLIVLVLSLMVGFFAIACFLPMVEVINASF